VQSGQIKSFNLGKTNTNYMKGARRKEKDLLGEKTHPWARKAKTRAKKRQKAGEGGKARLSFKGQGNPGDKGRLKKEKK